MLERRACEYFLFVSRFEYALKNTEFVKINSDKKVQPDWDGFFDFLQGRMKLDIDDDVEELLGKPPANQIYESEKLSWSKPQAIQHANIKEALKACLTVRNNLFHGGKHGDGNAGRNEVLLRASKKILEGALEVSPQVNEKFKLAEL